MKEEFYVNKNSQPKSGDYEVHRKNNCPHPASIDNQINLGSFEDCFSAVKKAKENFPRQASNINGCYYCCNRCHTS